MGTENDTPRNDLTIRVFSKEEALTKQIDALLRTHSILGSFMYRNQLGAMDDAGEVKGSLVPKFKEAEIASENAMIACCQRLESLLTSDEAWNLDFNLETEKTLKENMDTAKQVTAEQLKQLIETNTPHYKMGPNIMKVQDNPAIYCAFLGDINDKKNCIMGLGGCPQDALDDFDRVFLGTPATAKIIQLIQNHANKNLDNGGNKQSGGTSEPGQNIS